MTLYALLLLIAVALLIAMTNWRHGIFLLLVIGAVQDPIRKVTPGAPPYLVLATTPVWFVMLFRALTTNPHFTSLLRRRYPQLAGAMTAFTISLLPAAVVSATYGPGSWQLTLVGLFSYSTAIFGLYLGFLYPRDEKDVSRLAAFYCLVTAVMLLGTPLDYLGVAREWSALGGKALGYEWLRFKSGYVVQMFSGFYRSPDVMGWHAVLMTMLAASLALRASSGRRYFWIGLACWGIAAAMLCGRRKMVMMLPVYMLAVTWIYWRLQLRVRHVLAALAILAVGGYLIYLQIGANYQLESYYLDDQGDIVTRLESHNVGDIVATYEQNGFWGAGLGTATQGAQHLKVARPRTWQEGGLSRILVELGVPGLVCFLMLGAAFLATLLRLIQSRLDVSAPGFPIWVGLVGIVTANGVSFLYSHQIFGDPFVMCFFSFLVGISLAGERLGVVVKGADRRPWWFSRYGTPPFARLFAPSPVIEPAPAARGDSVAGGPGELSK